MTCKILSIILSFILSGPNLALAAKLPKQLYLYAEFYNQELVETALEFIQCVFEKENINVEVVDHTDIYPQLHLKESGNKIIASLVHAKQLRIALGEYAVDSLANSLCERTISVLSQESENSIANGELARRGSTNILEEKPRNFWQKNWPYFAIGGALVAGFLIINNSRSSPPASSTTYQAKGFTLE